MSGTSAPLEVMVVDDHPLVRSAIRQALDVPDVHVVAEAATASQVLELAPRLRPDVLLLDLGLPDFSGLEVVRELAPRLPDTKIVILSVSKNARDVLETMEHGAYGYLTKDVAGSALLATIRGVATGELAMERRMAHRVLTQLISGSRHRRRREPTALADLTPREREVLRLVANGLTDRGIAEAFGISRRTVESHVSRILHKLGVRTRGDAIRRFLEAS